MEQKDIFGLLLLPVIFGFFYIIWRYIHKYEKKKYDSLYHSENKTQAIVSKVSYFALYSTPGIFKVTIDYSFQDGAGKEFRGYGQFQDEKFVGSPDEIKKGDSITVYYLPKDPSVNALEQIVLKKYFAPTL